MSLPPEPPKSLKDRILKTIDVDPSARFRISRFNSAEPYLGKSASHRFDDPLKKFGTCYMGFSLEYAIAETLLHDLMPVKGEFRVPLTELESRYLVQFGGSEKLTLVDLTGAQLKTLVGSTAISTICSLRCPPERVEGASRPPAED